MALLNQLLEEAASESMRLSDEAKEAVGAIDHLVEHSQGLVRGVVSEGERVYGGLQTIAQSLIDSEQELQTAIDQTVGTAIDHVMERARDVRTHSASLKEHVFQALATLAEERQRIEDDLENQVQTTSTQFDEVAARMAEVERVTGERLQITRTAIAAVTSAVGQARDRLGEAEDRWQQELGEAENAARAQAAAYTAGVDALLNEQTNALVNLANAMIAAHNKAVVNLRRKYTEAAPAALRTAATSLSEAMQRLQAVCDDRTPPLGIRVQAIQKTVGEALEALEHIRSAAASTGVLDS